MLDYIKNIIPRIQGFSKKIDQLEIFVEKPWILIDDESNTHEYEFCRDGRLILSVNGDVTIGKWELRPSTNKLLIECGNVNTLYQHAFVNDSLFILKKSHLESIPFVLYNPNKIKDGNLISYFENYFTDISHEEVSTTLSIVDDKYQTFEGSAFTGTIRDEKDRRLCRDIVEGVVVDSYYPFEYKTINSKLIIHQENPLSTPAVGEKVIIKGQPVEDGKYPILEHEFVSDLIVMNSKIEKVVLKSNQGITYILIVLLLLVMLFFYAATNS